MPRPVLAARVRRGGEVDLKVGVGEIQRNGDYQVTSPPAIAGGLVITGSAVNDNQTVDAPSGVVRAYDARTGALRWAWSGGPRWRLSGLRVGPTTLAAPPPSPIPAAPPTGPWTPGTANVWSVISVDEELGLVYLPTGNAAPDYWAAERRQRLLVGVGGRAPHRHGRGRLADQTVHNDVWDFDVPAQPTLVTLRHDGEDVPALVQATKMGILFVLDRRTGESLFPIEERPVPQTDVAGETRRRRSRSPRRRRRSPPHARPRRRVRPARLRSQEVPRGDGVAALGRHVHAGQRARLAHVAGERRRLELGWHRGRSHALDRGGERDEPGVVGAPDPRAEFDAARAAEPDMEISPQRGTPYGMRREM